MPNLRDSGVSLVSFQRTKWFSLFDWSKDFYGFYFYVLTTTTGHVHAAAPTRFRGQRVNSVNSVGVLLLEIEWGTLWVFSGFNKCYWTWVFTLAIWLNETRALFFLVEKSVVIDRKQVREKLSLFLEINNKEQVIKIKGQSIQRLTARGTYTMIVRIAN